MYVPSAAPRALAAVCLLLSRTPACASLRYYFDTKAVNRSEDCGDTRYVPRASLKPRLHAKPPIASRCEEGPLGSHLLVTTTHTQDALTWMEQVISVPYLIYRSENETAAHRHPNFGNEAMGYLTFIAEYYDCLPEVTLFAHPHRESWHSFYSLDYNIERVRWEAVPGYAVLHRQGLWWGQHVRDPTLNLAGKVNQTKTASAPCYELINSTAFDGDAIDHFWRGEWISTAWQEYFGPAGLGPVPEYVRCPISAEFFVTRDRIRSRPREFYLGAIAWIMSHREGGLLRSYDIGCVLENIWHIIFGEPPSMQMLTVSECSLYRCGDPQSSRR